jgi:predicted SprT family Zn-dependent metalloprotease
VPTKLPLKSKDRPELGAALQTALVRELRATFRQLNDAHFRSALVPPTLELCATRATLGRWFPDTRTIAVSLPLVLEMPWGVVVEVLKHEMAHQYVHEVLREADEAPHGPAFRDVCRRLGVDARAAGMPSVSRASGDRGGAGSIEPGEKEERVVARIARLLALAESPNRNEAEAAMAAAQRLMLKHNLDAVSANTARAYGFAHLGRPTGRVGEHERLVAMILGKHFFVEAIWVPVYRAREGKRGSVLEICGAPANLAIAEYAHGFLLGTAERLWADHRRAHGLGGRERRTYLAGVMAGFADKLARQEATSRAAGLIWVKDGDLGSYLRCRHPYVRHVRHAGQRRTDAWAHGREAGRSIILHRPVAEGPSPRIRLLPPRG